MLGFLEESKKKRYAQVLIKVMNPDGKAEDIIADPEIPSEVYSHMSNFMEALKTDDKALAVEAFAKMIKCLNNR